MSSWRNKEFLRGNKGALRIPFLSFQLLRRPGCTAKLLCFHIAGEFESHRLHQNTPVFLCVLRALCGEICAQSPLGAEDRKCAKNARCSRVSDRPRNTTAPTVLEASASA